MLFITRAQCSHPRMPLVVGLKSKELAIKRKNKKMKISMIVFLNSQSTITIMLWMGKGLEVKALGLIKLKRINLLRWD